ncbi:hypothetical protein EBR03_06655 [bacterium]|nr:hypothetical protein [bacterium]
MEDEVQQQEKKRKTTERASIKVLDVEAKVEEILQSKMPEKQKEASLKKLGFITDKKAEGVSFEVYARIRKIDVWRQRAMLVYPKAKTIRLATLKQWDEIFKDF